MGLRKPYNWKIKCATHWEWVWERQGWAPPPRPDRRHSQHGAQTSELVHTCTAHTACPWEVASLIPRSHCKQQGLSAINVSATLHMFQHLGFEWDQDIFYYFERTSCKNWQMSCERGSCRNCERVRCRNGARYCDRASFKMVRSTVSQ